MLGAHVLLATLFTVTPPAVLILETSHFLRWVVCSSAPGGTGGRRCVHGGLLEACEGVAWLDLKGFPTVGYDAAAKGGAMRLQLVTWPEVERYLERSQGIIIPIGATEQHGPTGFVGTDAICAETLAWEVGGEAGALVAPTISVGMSEHHMAFPGSMTLRPSTLLLVVRDVVLSLARHGFRRFWFLNGHGGNTPTLQAAIFEVYAEVASQPGIVGELRCETIAWWETEAAERLSKELFAERDGDHATASEVSLALAAYPDHGSRTSLCDEAAESGVIYGSADFRRRYPDGRMGSDPTLASPTHGRTIRTALVPELAAKYREFVEAP